MKRWFRRLQTLDSQQAYKRWAKSYAPYAHNALMRLEETSMRSLLPNVTGEVVLDLASGTGRYGHILLERGARVVIGVDNSMEMLSYNALSRRILATAEALPFPANAFDGVVCALALGHLPSLDKAIGAISRVLKFGGWALISDFHPFQTLRGAQRTFEVNGRHYVVAHFVHLYADYHKAARAAGLQITDVIEPALPQLGPNPVILALRLRRD